MRSCTVAHMYLCLYLHCTVYGRVRLLECVCTCTRNTLRSIEVNTKQQFLSLLEAHLTSTE